MRIPRLPPSIVSALRFPQGRLSPAQVVVLFSSCLGSLLGGAAVVHGLVRPDLTL